MIRLSVLRAWDVQQGERALHALNWNDSTRLSVYTASCLSRLKKLGQSGSGSRMWDFPKIRVPYVGVLIMRILLFRVLSSGPLFFGNPHVALRVETFSIDEVFECKVEGFTQEGVEVQCLPCKL